MAAYDDSVCEFIEFLWEAGLAASYAGHAVSGVQFFLRLPKNALAESWALLTIWKRHEQPLQAPPMPVTVATALVAKAWTAQQCDMAVLVCLMYAACLRPEEALSLNRWQLEFSANARALAICLPVTKMTKRGRAEETVLVHDELALRLESRVTLLAYFQLVWKALNSNHGNLRNLHEMRDIAVAVDHLSSPRFKELGATWCSASRPSSDLRRMAIGPWLSTWSLANVSKEA